MKTEITNNLGNDDNLIKSASVSFTDATLRGVRLCMVTATFIDNPVTFKNKNVTTEVIEGALKSVATMHDILFTWIGDFTVIAHAAIEPKKWDAENFELSGEILTIMNTAYGDICKLWKGKKA